MIRLQGFEQLVKSPTRVTQDSSTLIDVILTNNEQAIASTDVAPLNMSDHDLIGCVRKVNHQKYQYRTITCRNYSNYDPKAMNDELGSQNLNDIYEITNIIAVWKFLNGILLNVFSHHAPIISKRVKGRHCPWLTPEVKTQMNRKDQLLRKARASNNKNVWSLYKVSRKPL